MKEKMAADERAFLIYESCLMELLKYCPKCGKSIDSTLTTEMQNTGSQHNLALLCFGGCDFTWSSQPEMTATRGIGNIVLTAANDMAGIAFTKLTRKESSIYAPHISKNDYHISYGVIALINIFGLLGGPLIRGIR